MTISIIVPIYKVEEYLPACVESIITQSFKDFELILVVNEHSPDRCLELCTEYSLRDSRITVVRINNGGVSAARNAGILIARGDYILFIDGDDFIAVDSLENLYKILKNDGFADVIFLSVAHYFPDGRTQYFRGVFDKSKLYGKSKTDAMAFISSLSDFNTSACLKLIRREIISINNILFAEDITFAEDTDFSLNVFLYAQSFNSCDSYIYYYRKGRKGSATYDYSEKKYRNLLSVITKWSDAVDKNPLCAFVSRDIYQILAFQYCLLLSGYDKIGNTFRKTIRTNIKEYSWLLGKSNDRRVSTIRWFYRLFGLKLTCVALTLRERFSGL